VSAVDANVRTFDADVLVGVGVNVGPDEVGVGVAELVVITNCGAKPEAPSLVE
jgi:hypothetical protein